MKVSEVLKGLKGLKKRPTGQQRPTVVIRPVQRVPKPIYPDRFPDKRSF